MRALPPDLVAYRRTPEFTEATVPEGLRRRHATKPGVWARIRVLEGRLRYLVLEPEVAEEILSPDRSGIVAPEIPHRVEPLGEVRFFVEFLRPGDPSAEPPVS